MTTKTVPELEAEIRVLRELVAAQTKMLEMQSKQLEAMAKQPAPAPQLVPMPCTRPHKDDVIPYVAPYTTYPQPWYPGGWPYGTITVAKPNTSVLTIVGDAPPLTLGGVIQHNACAAAPFFGGGTNVFNTTGCAPIPFVGNLS